MGYCWLRRAATEDVHREEGSAAHPLEVSGDCGHHQGGFPGHGDVMVMSMGLRENLWDTPAFPIKCIEASCNSSNSNQFKSA